MRDEFDGRDGVTYIGPRSFVAAFAVVCALFIALLFGANRLTEAIDSPEPIGATLDANSVPSAPHAPATAFVVRKTTVAPISPAAVASPRPTDAVVAPRTSPAAVASPRPGLVPAAPRASQSVVASPRPTVATKPAVARGGFHLPVVTVTSRAASAPTKLPPTLARSAMKPVAVQPPRALVRAASATATRMLVPFKSAAALPSTSALDPRGAPSSGLVVTPIVKPPIVTPPASPKPAGGGASP